LDVARAGLPKHYTAFQSLLLNPFLTKHRAQVRIEDVALDSKFDMLISTLNIMNLNIILLYYNITPKMKYMLSC